MSWSLTIGHFGATTVRVHLTFFLLLAWIGVSAWQQGGLPAARDSVLFIVLIFTCVVLHEFGHILMARRFGIETPDVILLPIGGVARMKHMPEKPAQELAVAVAGPMVNVVIAFLLPKTAIMMNLGNPDLAFRSAMMPNAGVGLARMEFIISEHIGVHPMALIHPEKIARSG